MQNSGYEVYAAYKKARKKFSIKTYLMFIIWLILGLIQWVVVAFVQPVRDIFLQHYYICLATFILAILFFTLFLFIEKLRHNKIIAIILSILIVELQIISLFTLVARSYFVEILMWFFICLVLILIFVVLGIFLPRKLDLTLHVALIFITAFLFLLMTVFFMMWHILIFEIVFPLAYVVVQLSITFTMLFFVMYHAQTIHGGRFAEMRLHDYCLGSLILFHDFLIIYWLTFYWQIIYRLVTPSDWPFYGSLLWNLASTTANPDKKHMRFDYNDNDDNNFDDTDTIIYNFPHDMHPGSRATTATEEHRMSITLDFRNDDDDKHLTNSFAEQGWQDIWKADESRQLAGRIAEGQRGINIDENPHFDFEGSEHAAVNVYNEVNIPNSTTNENEADKSLTNKTHYTTEFQLDES